MEEITACKEYKNINIIIQNNPQISEEESFQLPALYKIGGRNDILKWLIGFDGNKLFTCWGTLKQFDENRAQTTDRIVERVTGGELKDRARLQAESEWKKKIDRDGYSEKLINKNIYQLDPALANKWDPKKKQITTWPVWVQAKLDGVRLRAHTIDYKEEILTSRNSEDTKFLKHIREHLLDLSEAIKRVMIIKYNDPEPLFRLDGELFCNSGLLKFEDINGISKCKLEARKDEIYLQYYIFDIIFPFDETYRNRMNVLYESFTLWDQCSNDGIIMSPVNKLSKDTNNGVLHLLLPLIVNDKDGILNAHTYYVQSGYEGVIIRKIDGEESYYKPVRSSSILKYKSFEDNEFIVVGAKCGVDNAVIWKLKCDDGQEFYCKPMGEIETRRNIYIQFTNNPNQFIGRKYRCKYQELSNKGIPRFPTGLGFVEDR